MVEEHFRTGSKKGPGRAKASLLAARRFSPNRSHRQPRGSSLRPRLSMQGTATLSSSQSHPLRSNLALHKGLLGIFVSGLRSGLHGRQENQDGPKRAKALSAPAKTKVREMACRSREQPAHFTKQA